MGTSKFREDEPLPRDPAGTGLQPRLEEQKPVPPPGVLQLTPGRG